MGEFFLGSAYLTIMLGGMMLAAAGGGAAWMQKRRQQAALSSDTEGGLCIACGAAETVELHPEAWECPSCGYQQGEGWQRRRDEARLEKLMELSPEEATERAHAALLDARLMLIGAVGPFERPIIASRQADRHQQNWEVNPDLLNAVGDARTAHRSLQEAGMLDSDCAAALQSAGFSSNEAFPDTDELFDSSRRSTIEKCARDTLVVVDVWRLAAERAVRTLKLDA